MARKSRAASRPDPTPRKPAVGRTARSSEQPIIPAAVNRRILGRILLLSGVPFLLAFTTLPVAYWLIKSQQFPLPNVAVLLVNLGFFGLSVFGITYGLLSASWEPSEKGTLLGIKEFKQNGQRLISAIKADAEQRRGEKS
ncbi:MAG: PAM68 family protein [Gemmatimonadaceae bacterium]|nr:PAM68 family protein [Gloeobacterales cyanobacterium ES-bin-141]